MPMLKTIHQTQVDILKELLFVPEASFSELQKIAGLSSDHFKFHSNKLLNDGYIERRNGKYILTPSGKEYANKLDTDSNTIERQPKSAVIIVLFNDKEQVLVQERLKHPYYGFWGYPGGKIRWGETIMQAAARELREETALAGELAYRGVYHERAISAETEELLEDKIFHVVGGRLKSGKLKGLFEGGRNAWLTLEELAGKEKKYKSCDVETRVGRGEETFVEAVQVYDKQEF